jgi:hypothetical protein
MRRHLLVFDDGDGDKLDLQDFVDSLDPGAQMYAMDGHVCFVMSRLAASEVMDRFLKLAGSRLFFVTDITSSPSAGRMLGPFWDFRRVGVLESAAE